MGEPLEPSASRSVVRAVLLLLPVLALTAATPWVLDRLRAGRPAAAGPDRPPTEEEVRASSRADEALARAERTWEGSTAIAPSESAPDASGERVRWFQGFGLSIESEPSGARVWVNGEERGQTPLTTSVECKLGDAVRVEVRGQRAKQVRSTRCRADQLVEMTFQVR